jgi:hypothetical protein
MDIMPRGTARHALRFLISLLTMEALIHVTHIVTIKDARAWSGVTSAQLSMVGLCLICLAQGLSYNPWAWRCELLLTECWMMMASESSYFFPGDSFAYGRLWMG